MLQLRHVGLYVKDLSFESEFYQSAFNMSVLSENVKQDDELSRDILGDFGGYLLITKLLTEYGKAKGSGDMLELLQAICEKPVQPEAFSLAFAPGRMHLAFGVYDIENTAARIKKAGGSLITKIHRMKNLNSCCLAKDPEGNVLELIERAEELSLL